VLNLQNEGAQLVDVRDPLEFAGAHLLGSLNIGIDGRYATWAGTMLDKQRPIVVIAELDRVEEAIMRLGRIGFDHVLGYLDQGMDALERRPDLVSRTQRILAPDVRKGVGDVTIIDIRTASEVANGKIPGSRNIPLNELRARLDEVPKSGQVVVHCAGGYRSSIAASLLAQAGFANVVDLVGGYQAWLATQSDQPRAETLAHHQ
jgi:rhodanese-related sulfurtransferase